MILLAGIVTAFVYSKLPAYMPSHWNAYGQIDAYASKDTHIYLFLGLCAGIPLLMNWIPKLDPKYKNIKTFEGDFGWFTVALTAFMVTLYLYTTAIGLGYQLPIQNFMIPALSLLFFSIGFMLRKTKSNYTIGIRVPWTLHSEKNWEMTHSLAAKCFMYGATVMLLSLLLGENSLFGFLAVLTVVVLIPIIYSYTLHKKGI